MDEPVCARCGLLVDESDQIEGVYLCAVCLGHPSIEAAVERVRQEMEAGG